VATIAVWAPDVVGVLWTLIAAAIVMAPALHAGVSLGPVDLLSRFGLNEHAGVAVHNSIQADQIQQFVPWTDLAWHQMHAGHLPLWNPYNLLGMPLAFNWQSSVFSLPTLLSYAFPVRYAFTVIVLVRLMLAGTGLYTLCRVLGVGPLAAAFGGMVFELSGPILDHAAWPHVAVTCWAGWIFAFTVLLVRGRHRLRDSALLAVSVAMAVYGGHPESLVVLGVALLVFLLVWLPVRAKQEHGAVARPVGRVVVAGACGLALGAPLLLPGAQLGLGSVRRNGTGVAAFPVAHLPNLAAAGLQGLDFTTSAYVGVTALALGAVGVWAARRRPEAWAFVAVAVISLALTFFSPVDHLFGLIPGGHTVTWNRAVMLMALGMAVLAAFGIDAVARFDADRSAKEQRALAWWVLGAFGVGAAVVLVLAAAAVLGISHIKRHAGGLVWPGIEAAAGLVVAAALWWALRRPTGQAPARHARSGHDRPRAPGLAGAVGRFGAVALFAVEAAFLLSTGEPYWSVNSEYFPTNPGIATLQSFVQNGLVGYGSCRALAYLTESKAEVGFRPNANVGYRVRVMAVYDPILPTSYLRAWQAAGGEPTPPSLEQLGIFCARITNTTQAREFGVRFILLPYGKIGPPGTVPGGIVDHEELYSVPGAADATAVPLGPSGAEPPPTAAGPPVPVTTPDPASWRLSVDASAPSLLRLRLSAVPGWRATIDGHSADLRSWASGSMLEMRVPAGHHVVELHYWPRLFSLGLVLAAAVLALFVVAVVAVLVRNRRRRVAAT
jgi:hypothetical protein